MFLETSAKTALNVEEVTFLLFIKKIYSFNQVVIYFIKVLS